MPLEQFETFLSTVHLATYRTRYLPIKIVEMDLPKDIHAIEKLYEVYWDKKKFLDFDDFYKEYLDSKNSEIDSFRQKITMCSDCFYRGLPARIYRTWASIITQIHAGYVAESVFGEGSVKMSAELDHKGADFQVHYHSRTLNYQVKKKSLGREVRQEKPKAKNQLAGDFVDIKYEVPSSDYFENPKRKDGEYKLPYKRFIENKELKRFPNGFVVFTTYAFERKKLEIDQYLK
ncbi:MAG: Type-2 restriction enzyme TaqI [Parcubacteria group bacterium GW2011_GWF2_43_11]|nr:MAG: Type-2 restriction enzyme TaqI [Parcubacteria group bacterium GW2011_GWF2_43_11]